MTLEGLRSWLRHVFGSEPAFPHQMSFILELPFRRFLVRPDQLAERLHLTRASRVLEIGAGPGVFSVEIARRIPDGHLELFDLQAEMLERAKRKIEAADLSRVVGYTQGDARELPFPPATFDVALLVAVLGEVPEPRRCLRATRRALRPGGLLSITEHLPDPDFSRFSRLRALVEQEGFAFVERFGRPWSYTANFSRTEQDGACGPEAG